MIFVASQMFELEVSQNIFVTFSRSLSRTEYRVISGFGAIFGVAGVYAAWLDTVGRYEEMGIAFVAWVILQVPVYLLVFLVGHNFPRDFYFLSRLFGGS